MAQHTFRCIATRMVGMHSSDVDVYESKMAAMPPQGPPCGHFSSYNCANRMTSAYSLVLANY